MRSLNQCAQRGFSESVVPNRAILATPTRSGASNLDAIINEGTLTIGWVGPALLGIRAPHDGMKDCT